VIGLSNLPAKPGDKKSPAHPGPGSGYIVYCEGGRFEGQRGKGAAFDSSGKLIKSFNGNRGDVLHQANFIDAVRHRDASRLNADVAVGNDSTGWCNLANVAFRAGRGFNMRDANVVKDEQWLTVLGEMDAHLKAHGLALEGSDIQLSPMLSLDSKTQQFSGSSAAAGNRFLKRTYRTGYEVPELA
jgi:hypothetical protein